MIDELIASGTWLPYTFAFLIGLSMLLYSVLDGYDLGVGMLSGYASGPDRDRMIAAIGPFWDANETWLVLGVGLLLVAFPTAHGLVLGELYLPVVLMLIGLIFRGVAFDFRKKCPPPRQPLWDRAFRLGSLTAALTQGWMVGRFLTGLQDGAAALAFAAGFALLVTCGYLLMGATWLIIKAEGGLQVRAIAWTRRALWAMVAAAVITSLAALFTDTRIYERMFRFPELTLLLAMPLAAAFFTALIHLVCGVLPLPGDRLRWLPFSVSVAIFVLGFTGMVYSFYPDIIPGRLRIVDAAAAPGSLLIILIGTAVVMPVLAGYTALSYWIFRGKAGDLSYD